MNDQPGTHPYIPNSAPASRQAMLDAVGVKSVDELFEAIPASLKLGRPLNLPDPILSERDLKRTLEAILSRNTPATSVISFLGGGCWPHDIPAVCDEINSRAEFLTAYGGDTYADLGKHQAIFEFQSMIGELVGMEMVSAPVYDWSAAMTSALMMAARITGRRKTLITGTLPGDRRSNIDLTAGEWIDPEYLAFDQATGLMNLDDLRQKIKDDVASVYVEVPSYLGGIESDVAQIAEIAHAAGALLVVGVDAISLGVLAAPADYGADIVVGEGQALGVHMMYSGGLFGFIASRDEPRFVAEYPYLMVSIAPTRNGEGWGFGWSSMERTSYDLRENAPDYTGTTQWLWGITAAVYLSLLGPVGMREVGEGILQRSAYAMCRLGELPGVQAPVFDRAHFKEFVVNFDATGKTVAEINQALRARDIFGGHDLSRDFPQLGQSALYCVTEAHSKADIDQLVSTLEEVLA
ncbi:MAG: aminomethyl-transferring glycine dehydrogenase subunit GcvPA [Thermomicrobiales bacterium]|nr:aminomethyl-transferring glycine dehydrogenase subunit GcvPA [Thermomicrobiales bacterium]MCO5220069.1 aminomethyl-transferring glycine dehydrogenase subunit GcvPA [Thermomicrobiales bacterium]